MSEIVDINEAREIMVKSESFSQAIKKVNDAIRSDSSRGVSETSVVFYVREIAVYEAVASLLKSDGYDVEFVFELGPECSMIVSWRFDRWEEY